MILKKIACVTRMNCVRNETVGEKLIRNPEPALKRRCMEIRRECWKGKVENRKGNVAEKVLTGKGVGRRLRGHSDHYRKDVMHVDFDHNRISIINIH